MDAIEVTEGHCVIAGRQPTDGVGTVVGRGSAVVSAVVHAVSAHVDVLEGVARAVLGHGAGDGTGQAK